MSDSTVETDARIRNAANATAAIFVVTGECVIPRKREARQTAPNASRVNGYAADSLEISKPLSMMPLMRTGTAAITAITFAPARFSQNLRRNIIVNAAPNPGADESCGAPTSAAHG